MRNDEMGLFFLLAVTAIMMQLGSCLGEKIMQLNQKGTPTHTNLNNSLLKKLLEIIDK